MNGLAMWYFLYNLFLTIGFVLALPLMPILACLGPRYRAGLAQRFGFYSRNLLSSLAGSRPVWVHAASVGEVRSAAPLLQALKARAPQGKILLSTFTATGNHQARQIDAVDAVIFLPLDLIWITRRALAKFDPALLVIIETEIWPNLLRQAYRRGVPSLLLSGRLSARSLARYQLVRHFFARVLGCFSAFGMQSEEDAARVVNLGAEQKKVSVVGTLKGARWTNHDALDPSAKLRNGKPLLVAGSTHRGEEESLLEALALARAHFPTLSLVIAPRHPERFGDVERLLAHSDFAFRRRSQSQPAEWFDKDILLLDSVGELVDFFAAADVAFVGGSLVKNGGHNVLEPAGFGKPILFGPHMDNFYNLASDMLRQGAALEVANAAEIAAALKELLADPKKRRQMGERAAAIAAAHQGDFGLNFDLAARYL
jgi:3-deoxy-D-manno-octulosonic-acid transferase